MSDLVTDNLPLIATAPDGIKRLRGLILELAVRGKLVPQDPADEPASELLKRIEAEKARLVKEGKIRKLNDLDDQPFEAPQGWEWISLGSIATIERGGSPRPIKAFLTDAQDGLNWIKISDTDIGGKYITSAKEKIRPEGLSKTRRVFPGDFLLTNSMSFGRPYITAIEGCIHDGWLRISPPESLNKDYLYTLLSSPYVRRFFAAAAAGAVVMNLNADKVRELVIPLPPLPEQHRIVARVDALMALCDRLEAEQADAAEAHAHLVDALLATLTASRDAAECAANWQRLREHFDTLFTTETSITALKQTVLQLAVMGRLVPQDPEGRATLMIEEFCEVRGGLQKTPHRAPRNSHFPYLRVANVQRNAITTDVLERFELTPDELERWRLQKGDLLIVEGNGSENEIGRCAIWQGQIDPCVYQNHLIRVRPQAKTDVNYLQLYLNSPEGIETMKRLAITTSGLYNLSVGKIRGIAVPLPPLPEQHRIVARVDELMALCDRLQADLATARDHRARLADTLVQAALEAA